MNKQELEKENERLQNELARYKRWVKDLQSGMYINCVYCGHRYGPADEVPASMAEALKNHVENCPEHPMSALKDNYDYLNKKYHKALEKLRKLAVICNGYNVYPESAVAAAKVHLDIFFDENNLPITEYHKKVFDLITNWLDPYSSRMTCPIRYNEENGAFEHMVDGKFIPSSILKEAVQQYLDERDEQEQPNESSS